MSLLVDLMAGTPRPGVRRARGPGARSGRAGGPPRRRRRPARPPVPLVVARSSACSPAPPAPQVRERAGDGARARERAGRRGRSSAPPTPTRSRRRAAGLRAEVAAGATRRSAPTLAGRDAPRAARRPRSWPPAPSPVSGPGVVVDPRRRGRRATRPSAEPAARGGRPATAGCCDRDLQDARQRAVGGRRRGGRRRRPAADRADRHPQRRRGGAGRLPAAQPAVRRRGRRRPGPARAGASSTARAAAAWRRYASLYGLRFEVARARTSCGCRAGTPAGAALGHARRAVVIPALALVVGVRARPGARADRARPRCSRTCRSPSWPRSTRSSARSGRSSTGSSTTRSSSCRS